MVLVGSTVEDNIEAQERERKYQFYRETISVIHTYFVEGNTEEIQNISGYINDEILFTKLSSAIDGEIYKGEEALFITEGKFFIFGDEFSEEDIRRICQALYREDDLDFIMNLSASLEVTHDSRTSILERIGFFFSNFPGNVISGILEGKRGELIVGDHLVFPDKGNKDS